MARYGYGSFWGYQETVIATPEAIRKRLGRDPIPVSAPPRKRKTAESFWGQAWCEHLETYGGMANRLPRGRTYLRQGAVRDLYIERGRITALVQGTQLYEIVIAIEPLAEERVAELAKRLGGKLSSAVELLSGRMDAAVVGMITEPAAGLFPKRAEIGFSCSCPDGAYICKHIAAVFYGIGRRLDARPELFFELRGTSAERMVAGVSHLGTEVDSERQLDGDLGAIFGIELSEGPAPIVSGAPEAKAPKRRSSKAPTPRKKALKRRSRKSQARPEATSHDDALRASLEAAERRRKSHAAEALSRKEAKASKAKKASWSRRKVATRAELLAAGLASSTVQGWLRQGHLEPTEQRGRYRLTSEARRRLAEREG